jgi:hypothetical protein
MFFNMFFLHPQKLGPQIGIQKSLHMKKLVDVKTIISPKNHGYKCFVHYNINLPSVDIRNKYKK